MRQFYFTSMQQTFQKLPQLTVLGLICGIFVKCSYLNKPAQSCEKILGIRSHEIRYVLITEKAKLPNTLTQTLRLLHDSIQTFKVGGVIVWLCGVVQQRPHGLDLTYCVVTLLLTWSGRSADIYQVVYAVSHRPEIITFVSVISPSLTRLYTPRTEFLFNNCLLTLASIYYMIFATSDCIILLPSAWVRD